MISFFIDYEGTTYQLPVTPSSLEVTSNMKDETHDVVGLGEVSTFGGLELRVFKVECFFPKNNNYSFINTSNDFMAPEEYIELFTKIQAERKPCRFIVTDIGINTLASVIEFTHMYDYGTEDVKYILSLREFKEVSIKTLEPAGPPKKKRKPTDNDKNPIKKKNSESKMGGDEFIENPPDRPKEGWAINDKVRVTGNYFYTSLGDKPFGTFPQEFIGIITHIALKNKLPYHISNLNGGAMGWVQGGQLSRA